MRAVVYDRYGPPEVLRLEEVDRPVPREDEVLVKIHATTVNRADVHIREANRRSGLAAAAAPVGHSLGAAVDERPRTCR